MVRKALEKRQHKTLNLLARVGRESQREGEQEEVREERRQDDQTEEETQEPHRDEKEKEGELKQDELAMVERKMLDCSFCSNPLIPPLFQCSFGHVMCMPCTERLGNKCHVCSCTTKRVHNVLLEKLLESARIFCPNKKYGCKALIPYRTKDTKVHKKTCNFFPCFCPVDSCESSSSARDMKAHLIIKHGCIFHDFSYGTEFKVQVSCQSQYEILVAKDGCTFILTAKKEPIGLTLSMICVRTADKEESKFWYDLKVYDNEDYFGKSISFFSASVCGSTLERNGEDRAKDFVLVSDDHLQVLSSGNLILSVCIKPVDQPHWVPSPIHL